MMDINLYKVKFYYDLDAYIFSPFLSSLFLLLSSLGKVNLAVFESSNISKTKDITPTKIGVYVLDINPYMHEFFQSIPID